MLGARASSPYQTHFGGGSVGPAGGSALGRGVPSLRSTSNHVLMRTDLFDYELPDDRIALYPARPRDAARLSRSVRLRIVSR